MDESDVSKNEQRAVAELNREFMRSGMARSLWQLYSLFIGLAPTILGIVLVDHVLVVAVILILGGLGGLVWCAVKAIAYLGESNYYRRLLEGSREDQLEWYRTLRP